MRQDIALVAAAFAASAMAVPYASAEKRQELPSGYWDAPIEALPSDYWRGAQAEIATSVPTTTQPVALASTTAYVPSAPETTLVTSTVQMTTTATTIPIASSSSVIDPVSSGAVVAQAFKQPLTWSRKSSATASLPTTSEYRKVSATASASTSSETSSSSATASALASSEKVPTNNDEVAPAGPQVTNPAAFTSGAGNKDQTDSSSLGAGANTYQCYQGAASAYPDSSKWVHFPDMWKANSAMMTTPCYGGGAANTPEQTQDIYDGIMAVAKSSLVDPRFVLAIVMQESNGCVNVGTTSNGVTNPGIMQDHNGASYVGNSASAAAQQKSIMQLIIDGTQGTSSGDGLVQLINKYGTIYDAARGYNSGSTDPSNLNAPVGATAGYVNDVANRMTGWTGSESKFSTCSQ